MEIKIINIGHSRGIIIPKTILNQYNITDTVELILEQDRIILQPKSTPRKGWEKAFKAMHENEEDSLLIDDIFEDENFEEWL